MTSGRLAKWNVRRGLLKVSVVAVLLYVCVCAYFWAVQIELVLKPRRDLPSNPGRMGLVFEEVDIPLSSDGNSAEGELKAYWVPAENSDAPVLLYLHGQDATRGKNLIHAKSLHECGLHVLVPDYRGFAETFDSEQPSESKVYEDAVAALKYLKVQRGFAPEKILIYGHSLGGAVAVDLATRKEAEGTAGLIIECTFTSILDMSDLQYHGFLQLLPVNFLLTERFDSASKIQSIRQPILIIHGTDDMKVPCTMSQQLAELAGEQATLCMIDGAGHEDCCTIGLIEYQQQIKDFVTSCLNNAK